MMRHLIFLLAALLAAAQRPETIHQRLWVGLTKAPVYSGPIRNLGAVSHMLVVTARSQAGHTCAAGAVNIGLEASYDQSVWLPVGTQLAGITADANGNLSAVTTAQGAYPYVQAAVRSFDTTNCQLDVYYTGSQGPQSVVAIENAPSETKWQWRQPMSTQVDLASATFPYQVFSSAQKGKLLGLMFTWSTLTVGSGSPVVTLEGSTDGAAYVTWWSILTGTAYTTPMAGWDNSTYSADTQYLPADHHWDSNMTLRVNLTGGTYTAGILRVLVFYAEK